MSSFIKFFIDLMARSLHVFLGLGGVCIYQPTCSQYAHQAINRHGFIVGAFKSFLRILRCHPLAKGGVDPVK